MLPTVGNVVSPSHFVGAAAVDLGFFRADGVDAGFLIPPADQPQAFRLLWNG